MRSCHACRAGRCQPRQLAAAASGSMHAALPAQLHRPATSTRPHALRSPLMSILQRGVDAGVQW